MLGTRVPPHAAKQLGAIDEGCEKFCEDEGRPKDCQRLMPFGHGIFSVVRAGTDLHLLWKQRIVHLLVPPGREPHPLYDTIVANYPWKDSKTFVPPERPRHDGHPEDDRGARTRLVADQPRGLSLPG